MRKVAPPSPNVAVVVVDVDDDDDNRVFSTSCGRSPSTERECSMKEECKCCC